LGEEMWGLVPSGIQAVGRDRILTPDAYSGVVPGIVYLGLVSLTGLVHFFPLKNNFSVSASVNSLLTIISSVKIRAKSIYIECGVDEAPLADKTANCPHTRRSENAVNPTSVSFKRRHPSSI
jgi:hypothetical protein